MIKCPNCGRRTTGDSCQWCSYPILKGRPIRRRKTPKLAAKEETKRKAKEARQAREAQIQADKAAKLAAKEEAKKKTEEAQQAKEAQIQAAKEAKQIGKSLKQVEETCEQLRTEKIGAKEAIRKLLDISERTAK